MMPCGCWSRRQCIARGCMPRVKRTDANQVIASNGAGPTEYVALSWLLFQAAPEVREFVALRAESSISVPNERFQRCMRIAWERDERGWRTKYTAQAGAVRAA